jgi:hypothetical protein
LSNYTRSPLRVLIRTRKLGCNVIGGDVPATLARAASLQQIAGKKPYMGTNLLRVGANLGTSRPCRHSIHPLADLGVKVKEAQPDRKDGGRYALAFP